MADKNKNPIEKLASFAFTMGVLGVATIGICPAFGVMAMVVPIIMKIKKAPVSEEVDSKNKKSFFLGAVAVVMFFIDLAIISFAHEKLGWFNLI